MDFSVENLSTEKPREFNLQKVEQQEIPVLEKTAMDDDMYFLRSPSSQDKDRGRSFQFLASKIEEKKQELSMSKESFDNHSSSNQSSRSNPIVSICIESDGEEEEAEQTKTQTPVTGKSVNSYTQSKIPRLKKL